MRIWDEEDKSEYEIHLEPYDEEPYGVVINVEAPSNTPPSATMLRTLIPDIVDTLKTPKSRIISIDNEESKLLIISLFSHLK
jgi:hypothetical protein